MKIIKYSVKDLKKELQQNNLWNREVLPISRHRALSFVNNPNADEDDVVLFIGWDNENIIGYICVLPDKILFNNVEHKIAWASSWWSDRSKKNGIVAGLLFLTASNHYYLAASEFTDSAKKAFNASGKLSTMKELKGFAFIVRSCISYILLKKYKGLKKLGLFLRCIDHFINMFVDLRLFIWKRKNSLYKINNFEFISQIDEETDQFIKKTRKSELLRRNAKELNWIIKYPWILSAPCADKTVPKYFFSSISKRFFYLNMKVYGANDKMTGFVMLKVRDNVMSIPYLYSDNDALTNILYLIGFLIIELNIDIFISYNKEILDNLSKIKFPYLYKKNRSMLYYISNKFKDVVFEDFVLQDGNGDAVFT